MPESKELSCYYYLGWWLIALKLNQSIRLSLQAKERASLLGCRGWGLVHALHSSTLHSYYTSTQWIVKEAEQIRHRLSSFSCFIPIPCAPFMEDTSPVFTIPTIRTGDAYSYSLLSMEHWKGKKDLWVMRRYLVHCHTLMKSCKKR